MTYTAADYDRIHGTEDEAYELGLNHVVRATDAPLYREYLRLWFSAPRDPREFAELPIDEPTLRERIAQLRRQIES